jgi:hypothetical protein
VQHGQCDKAFRKFLNKGGEIKELNATSVPNKAIDIIAAGLNLLISLLE